MGARTYYPALRSLLEINLTSWPEQLKRPESMQDHKQHIGKDDNIAGNDRLEVMIKESIVQLK